MAQIYNLFNVMGLFKILAYTHYTVYDTEGFHFIIMCHETEPFCDP